MRLIDNDYISRSWLISALSEFNDTENGNWHFILGIKSALEIVENAPAIVSAPAADVAEVKWISVNDRLPQDGKRVLVVISAAKQKSIYMDIDTDRRVNGKWVRWDRCITHWMPLPALPKMDGGSHDDQ